MRRRVRGHVPSAEQPDHRGKRNEERTVVEQRGERAATVAFRMQMPFERFKSSGRGEVENAVQGQTFDRRAQRRFIGDVGRGIRDVAELLQRA